MRKVILDCDNTFGLGNRDVDDGLTLFYLLGSPVIDLLGVTLTYGNDTLEKVTQMTKELQRRLDLSFNYYGNHQAEFLAEQVNCYPNEVTILATGALTNLAEAKKLDPLFFEKVKEIIVMGGTTEPLVVNHHPVTELNFSCDPLAAETVLLSQVKVVIMNGHMTSEAFFSITELEQFLSLAKEVIPQERAEWIRSTLEKWIEWNEEVFNFSGFCNWDMTTAVYLERPELFSNERFYLAEQQPTIDKGRIILTEKSIYSVRMPKKLLTVSEFNQLIIDRMVKGLQ